MIVAKIPVQTFLPNITNNFLTKYGKYFFQIFQIFWPNIRNIFTKHFDQICWPNSFDKYIVIVWLNVFWYHYWYDPFVDWLFAVCVSLNDLVVHNYYEHEYDWRALKSIRQTASEAEELQSISSWIGVKFWGEVCNGLSQPKHSRRLIWMSATLFWGHFSTGLPIKLRLVWKYEQHIFAQGRKCI